MTTAVEVSEKTAIRSFYSHHKTASTWGRIILGDAAAALDLTVAPIMSPPHWEGYASPGDMVRDVKPDILVVTDPKPELMADLPPTVGFHVIRDPRDIVVSSYYSHMNSHPTKFWGVEWPELVPHREALKSMSHDDGLLKEMEFSGWMIDTMDTWDYEQPGMMEIKMEDFTADPVTWWIKVFDHLGLLAGDDTRQVLPMARVKWNLARRIEKPRSIDMLRTRLRLGKVPIAKLPKSYVEWTIGRFSFENLAGGRVVGQEDQNSHYRRGIAGDWRNHFTDTHIAAFRDRYGDLVEKLGYSW